MSYQAYLPMESPEDQNLISPPIIPQKSSKKSYFLAYTILFIFLSILTVFVVTSRTGFFFPNPSTTAFNIRKETLSFYKNIDISKIPSDTQKIIASTNDIYLTAMNEYGHFDAPYPWMKDIPGTQLIEPYKTSTLTLTGNYPATEGYSFIWVINDEAIDWNGPVFDLTVPEVGKFPIDIHAYDKEGNYLATYSTLLVSKYVKREIHSLTDSDREAVLDAMAAIWQYSQEEGKALFGEKFTSIDTYVTIHSEASNDIMCDQYHEGTGFLTHHLAMGVSFEASLRAVNPAVTMPYWDFTIEGEQIYKAGKPPSYLLQISDILTAKWFGSVDENNHIQDGRWAHALMPIAQDEKTTQNSYGYIRSYWNNNPDPEISRHLFDSCGAEPEHKAIPHCSTHYDILNANSLGTIQLLTPGDGHGPMHVQTGGVWGGCNAAYASFLEKWSSFLDTDMSDDEILSSGNELASFKNKWGPSGQRRMMIDKAIIGEYFHIYRSLWRSHMCAVDNSPALLTCPKSCDYEHDSFETCSCAVDKLANGETTWQNLYPCILNSESNQKYFSSTMPEELLSDLTSFIATSSVLEGEMIESASTADPMFWMIHPVIERLVAAKRLPDVTRMGSKPFSKPTTDYTKDDWLSYSYYNLKANTNKYHPDEYTCVGHDADDPALPGGYSLPYTDAIENVADADNDGVVTNWEFFQAIDPNNIDGNDYVFDNFLWDHCS